MQIYRVGGSLRDALIGVDSLDIDYVVLNCTESELLKQYPRMKKVGRKKSVYILNGNEYTLSSFFSIEEDLMARDLTINSLAMDDKGKLYHHPYALQDLDKKIFRPVSEGNFFDDPLRVFRAARFAARFSDYTFSDELKDVMRAVAFSNKLGELSPERVGQELRKAFATEKPSRFFYYLEKTGCLIPWFKELAFAVSIPAGPVLYHGQNSLFDHMLEVMDLVAGDPLIVWMAFCHDLGKIFTKKEIFPKHYGHEIRGIEIAEEMGLRVRLPRKLIQAGKVASRLHMKAGLYDKLKPSTKVELLIELGKTGLLENLFSLVKADKGLDFMELAKNDLNMILNVKLPSSKKGLGEKSGDLLFQMRCNVIKKTSGR